MSIRLPDERMRQPSIGSNHVNSMCRRKGDETSTLIERDADRVGRTFERGDKVALRSEGLQALVLRVGDDDAPEVIDTQAARSIELALATAALAELEQERTING